MYVHYRPYVDEVLVGAADDVVVGDGDGVDAAPAGLQDVNALQRADVPNLPHRDREREADQWEEKKKKKEKDVFGTHEHSRAHAQLSAVEKVNDSTAGGHQFPPPQ